MTITFPKLEKWQKDVFSYLKLGGKDWYVVKSIRQCGKSVLAEILLIYSAFKTPCSVSLSVSPVVSQSRKMYEDILRIASKLVYKSNGSTLEIIFFNGSKIIFRSAEQGDSIRGITVKGSGILVVDEAAYIQDDILCYSYRNADVNSCDAILICDTNNDKIDTYKRKLAIKLKSNKCIYICKEKKSI